MLINFSDEHHLKLYQVRPSGEHIKKAIKTLIEGITDYDDFILRAKNSSELLKL